MGGYLINPVALAGLQYNPKAKAVLLEVAKTILDEAQENILTMGAYDTGAMLESGFVRPRKDGAKVRVGFNVEYAPIVHEGSGLGRNATPRPFLGQAAAKNRGRLR